VGTDKPDDAGKRLADELRNFEEIVRHIDPSPGEIPRLDGVEIAGMSMPLRSTVGGDHIIYIDFNRRYNLDSRIGRAQRRGDDRVAANLEALKRRAGILVADVSGHRITDSLIGAMMHQAFLVGVYYELDRHGEISPRIFEHINQRFYRTTAVNKYFTMIYGEISDEGQFRFISAGHQLPVVFSREFGRFMTISDDRLVSYPPVGLLPSDRDPERTPESEMSGYKTRYAVNELSLLSFGDTLLLLTDGLADHDGGSFFPEAVERLLADCADEPVERVCERLKDAILERAAPTDDISFVALRRTK